MDEPRVEGPKRHLIEAETGEPADPGVLDEDVRVRQEPPQDLGAIGRLEVETETAFVPVDGEVVGRRPVPVGRFGAYPRRSPAAGRIALRRLHLDDVRPQVAEKHRAVRPGEDR